MCNIYELYIKYIKRNKCTICWKKNLKKQNQMYHWLLQTNCYKFRLIQFFEKTMEQKRYHFLNLHEMNKSNIELFKLYNINWTFFNLLTQNRVAANIYKICPHKFGRRQIEWKFDGQHQTATRLDCPISHYTSTTLARASRNDEMAILASRLFRKQMGD